MFHLRSTITNTRKANWWINAPVQVVGMSTVGLPGIPPPNPGGAIDAQSGNRVVAVATHSNGMPWNLIGYYQKYTHVRRTFDITADLLREQLWPASMKQAPEGF